MTRAGVCWMAVLLWACALDREGSLEASPGTGGAATVVSSTATATDAATVGTGGAAPTCGNGSLEGTEACDDGNAMAGDGCDAGCAIEKGWDCSGMPSSCAPIAPTEVTVAQSLPITDDGYDGNPTSMTCHILTVTTPYTSIQEIRVTLGISHNSIGDLVIKLVSPTNEVTTLLNRPGMNEPDDLGADCANPTCGPASNYGDLSNLSGASPVTFFDAAMTSAEDMGADIGGPETVCQDDAICEFTPSPGSGPGTNLADFNETDPNGDWSVCVGDAAPADAGDLELVTLSILAY